MTAEYVQHTEKTKIEIEVSGEVQESPSPGSNQDGSQKAE
jgi:hypothetical protein